MSLSGASEVGPRLIPVILGDSQAILRRSPLPLADMVYLRWSDGIPGIVGKITLALKQVEELGADYWGAEAHESYRRGEYERAALYARKALGKCALAEPGKSLRIS